MKINYLFILSNSIIFINYNEHFSYSNSFIFNDCYFSRTVYYNGNDHAQGFSGGWGGIIFCYDSPSNLKLINCIFYQCSCSGYGGAICFYSPYIGTNSEIINICANECYTFNNEWYQFACIATYNSINSNNTAKFLSVINCSNFNAYCSFCLYYGNINLNNYNSSNNINKELSGIYLIYPSKFIGYFCSFFKNFVSSKYCIGLNGNNNNIFFNFNFKNNNSSLEYGVITNKLGTYIIEKSNFLNNFNLLFSIISGQLIISNSNIYHNNNSIGIISLINNSFILTNTLNIQFLNKFKFKINKNSFYLFKNIYFNNFSISLLINLLIE